MYIDAWIASSQLVFCTSSSFAPSVVGYTRRLRVESIRKAFIRVFSLFLLTTLSSIRSINSLGVFLIGSRRPILIGFSALGASFTLSGSVEAFFDGLGL